MGLPNPCRETKNSQARTEARNNSFSLFSELTASRIGNLAQL